MTEREAIEWLAPDTSKLKINMAELNEENPLNYINEAIEIAIEALEKQIPKKIISKGSDKVCPSCGETLIEAGYMYTYCDICGQKLDMDWSVKE